MGVGDFALNLRTSKLRTFAAQVRGPILHLGDDCFHVFRSGTSVQLDDGNQNDGCLVSKSFTVRCFIRPVERKRPRAPKKEELLALLLFFSIDLPSSRMCISLGKVSFWDESQSFIMACSRSGAVTIKGCSLSLGADALLKRSIYATMRKYFVKELIFFQSRKAKLLTKLTSFCAAVTTVVFNVMLWRSESGSFLARQKVGPFSQKFSWRLWISILLVAISAGLLFIETWFHLSIVVRSKISAMRLATKTRCLRLDCNQWRTVVLSVHVYTRCTLTVIASNTRTSCRPASKAAWISSNGLDSAFIGATLALPKTKASLKDAYHDTYAIICAEFCTQICNCGEHILWTVTGNMMLKEVDNARRVAPRYVQFTKEGWRLAPVNKLVSNVFRYLGVSLEAMKIPNFLQP